MYGLNDNHSILLPSLIQLSEERNCENNGNHAHYPGCLAGHIQVLFDEISIHPSLLRPASVKILCWMLELISVKRINNILSISNYSISLWGRKRAPFLRTRDDSVLFTVSAPAPIPLIPRLFIQPGTETFGRCISACPSGVVSSNNSCGNCINNQVARIAQSNGITGKALHHRLGACAATETSHEH